MFKNCLSSCVVFRYSTQGSTSIMLCIVPKHYLPKNFSTFSCTNFHNGILVLDWVVDVFDVWVVVFVFFGIEEGYINRGSRDEIWLVVVGVCVFWNRIVGGS